MRKEIRKKLTHTAPTKSKTEVKVWNVIPSDWRDTTPLDKSTLLNSKTTHGMSSLLLTQVIAQGLLCFILAGVGWTSYDAPDTGETPPKRGTFLRLYFLKRVRIGLQLKYFEPNTPVGCTNLIYETRKRGFAVSRSPGSCC